MKTIEIKLSQSIVAPLLDFIKTVADDLRTSLVIEPQFPDRDPDLQESWRKDLIDCQGEDIGNFMSLFDRNFFETGNVVVDENNADAILRAAAAIRLKIRTDLLKDIPDEVLERGEVPFEEMPLQDQQAYACYLFLATIQEIVIQHMDFAAGK